MPNIYVVVLIYSLCDFPLFYIPSAGNKFSLFRGHMSFQIFLLVGHLTNWTGNNLLTDNTLKKTQDVLVTRSVIVSNHNVKLAGHFQNLVGQCPMTDCYFQHCISNHGKPYLQRKTKNKPNIYENKALDYKKSHFTGVGQGNSLACEMTDEWSAHVEQGDGPFQVQRWSCLLSD